VLKAFGLQRLAYLDKGTRLGCYLELLILLGDIFGTGFDGCFEELLEICSFFIQNQPFFAEHPGHAASLAHVAVAFGENTTYI
jgi:hypothetical protein